MKMFRNSNANSVLVRMYNGAAIMEDDATFYREISVTW